MVIRLLTAGADILAKDYMGWTPLHYAAWDGGDRREIATYLRWRGTDIDAQDMGGNTALHYAAGLGNGPLVEVLLHKTPAYIFYSNNPNVRDELKIPNVLIKNHEGYTALDMAILEGYGDIALMLMKFQVYTLQKNTFSLKLFDLEKASLT